MRTSLLAAAAALAVVSSADAQSPPASTPDPVSIWTLQDENASASLAGLTDRYYVNGLKLGWTSGTEAVPDPIARAGRVLWGDGQMRISFSITQEIDTAADTQAHNPPLDDRPYAGVLLGNFGLMSDTPTTRSSLTISAGVIGPWALAEEVQNGFHDIIGQGHTNGWHYQVGNQPAIEAAAARVWRMPITQLGALDVDALPEVDGGVGDVRIYAQGGAVLRLGQGLDSDYGPPRLAPGMTGGDVFRPTQPFAWYVFAGGSGRAVAYDATLDGNPFVDGRHVSHTPVIGEFEAGLALMAFGTRLTYTQVFQTAEFSHQKGGLHEFGSLALSVRF